MEVVDSIGLISGAARSEKTAGGTAEVLWEREVWCVAMKDMFTAQADAGDEEHDVVTNPRARCSGKM